ncbi:PAS domain-containing protein [Luteimonas marina]|uniref:histidine kinase n=1 Tax=Luteimonas marina TaxID=488485 RepID=A0A5C5UAH6_9GAMM|nr:ATP-binding protein [Luteimonas marina]TWT22512.1 PAS domain-containing protein [Luteimonas marina]
MSSSALPQPLSNWRLPALGLAIALIVVTPFLLLRGAAQDNDAAQEMVAHSYRVEARVHALASDMRNLEAGALSLAAGVDNPALRARVGESRARLLPTLQELQHLTRDHPDQQRRIDALQSNIVLRKARADSIIDSDTVVTAAEIDAMVARYPIHELITAIIGEEQRLLAIRQARAERVERRTRIGAWTAMFAQLLLLGGLFAYSTRQVSHRLRAEHDALRASARASVVLDTVREPIVLADHDLRVVMHNAAFAELYGVSGDARGQRLADIGGGAWRDERTLRRLGDVLARGRELWDHEQVQRTADEVERTMLINARPMPLPDRDDAVALITASDVSVQKASDRQIRELNRQLEGKVEQVSDVNRELEAFSYSVSHDLRAPLRHIAGFGDKLERHLGEGIDDKSKHYLEVMVSSARRMSALIDDLLVYSRLGRSALRLQTVDMQSLVDETRAMLDSNNTTEAPGHAIEWRVAPLPVVAGDENMLRQVWLNLLGNAVKYSRGSEPARIEVACQRTDDGHHFQVRDNGAGFDMRYAGKLFGVFQRLHAASEFPGTGIGLASVRRVLARHGGRIWAEAEPGAGATFHFTLPVMGDMPGPNESST